MKKTFNVDKELLRQAKDACGATTDTEAIRLGLESLIRQAAYERLAAFGGTEPHAQDVPRRRPEFEDPQERKAGAKSSRRRAA